MTRKEYIYTRVLARRNEGFYCLSWRNAYISLSLGNMILTTVIIASIVGILTVTFSLFLNRNQEKAIKQLQNDLMQETIRYNVELRLLEERYDKLFAQQDANVVKAAEQLNKQTVAALNQFETRFKSFQTNFTNNY